MKFFSSSATNKVDAKGRVSIPAPFRKVLAAENSPMLYLRPEIQGKPAIEGFGEAYFDKEAAALEQMQPTDPAFEALADLMISRTSSMPLDETGTMQYFGLPGMPDIEVADAVYASSCLPGIFEPLEVDGEHFIDGGMGESLCLNLGFTRKADLVIAVDLSTRDYHSSVPYRASLPHILLQTYEIMGNALNEQNLHRHAGRHMVLIKPNVAFERSVRTSSAPGIISSSFRRPIRSSLLQPASRKMRECSGPITRIASKARTAFG